jgi:hypothetical protein
MNSIPYLTSKKNVKRVVLEEKKMEPIVVYKKETKIIQTIDLEKLEELKKTTIEFYIQSEKRKYIHEYFRRNNTDNYYKRNTGRPSMASLINILLPTIQECYESDFFQLMYELDGIVEQTYIYQINVVEIIDVLYDYCKSINMLRDNVVF